MRYWFFAIFAALLLLAPRAGYQTGAANAADAKSFVIAAGEGYGIEDCLGEGGECGQVVADAWCEAHGHGAALHFGRAEDVTSSIRPTPVASTPRMIVITCGD